LALAAAAVVIIALPGHRSWRQIGLTAVLLIPGIVAGYLLTPDRCSTWPPSAPL